MYSLTSVLPRTTVLISLLSSYLASALPVDTVPRDAADQCGPNPPVPGIADTCQAPLVSSPGQAQIWGVNCFPQPSDVSVTLDDCSSMLASMCKHFSETNGFTSNRWMWSYSKDKNCALGYWAPPPHIVNGVTSTPAPPPTYDRCMSDIFPPLIKDCSSDGKTMQSFAGVNLLNLPQGDFNGTTATGGENYWSFAVANTNLTKGSAITGAGNLGFHWAAAAAAH